MANNDKEMLEAILREGFRSGSPSYYELELLARYYRGEGHGEKGIRKRVIEMSRRLYTGFNPVVYFDYLNGAVSSAIKKGSVKPMKEFAIYLEELEAIRQIRDYKSQLIIHSFLVNMKAGGYRSIRSIEKDIKAIIWMTGTKVSYRSFLRDYRIPLQKAGLLKYVVFRRDKLKSRYILPFALDSGTPLMVYSNLSQVEANVERYREWTGGTLMWCSECGAEVVRRSPRQVRCDTCSMDAKRENQKNLMRKRRS